MTSEKADTRRYGTMTKAQVAQCAEFGASIAKIAMANGVNANVVHRWRKLARGGNAKAATKTGEFIELPLTMAPPRGAPITSKSAGADLHVELRRGAITMSITWSSSATTVRSLDPRRWPWRRILMDTQTI
jgi:transposase